MKHLRNNEPTQERLKELFKAVSDRNGIAWANAARGGRRKDDGSYKDRYRCTVVDGTKYKHHRLVWIFFNGAIPEGVMIDHRDGDKLNNHPSNLRLATNADNVHNRGANQNNSTGFKNVCRHNKGFRVEIKINGKRYKFGTFPTATWAALAADAIMLKAFGEFACTNAKQGLLPDFPEG